MTDFEQLATAINSAFCARYGGGQVASVPLLVARVERLASDSDGWRQAAEIWRNEFQRLHTGSRRRRRAIRVCASCGKPIIRRHKWRVCDDGKFRHRVCGSPTFYEVGGPE